MRSFKNFKKGDFPRKRKKIETLKIAFSGWICVHVGPPIHSSNLSPTGYVQRALWAGGSCARKNKVVFQFNIQLQTSHRSKWTNSSSRVCGGRRGASSQTCPSEWDLETSFCQVEESPKEKRHLIELKVKNQTKQSHVEVSQWWRHTGDWALEKLTCA